MNDERNERRLMRRQQPASPLAPPEMPAPAVESPLNTDTRVDPLGQQGGGIMRPDPIMRPDAPQRSPLGQAVQTARANNYSDIEGAQGIAAGGFQGQLEGFGNIDPGGERGSNTHKKLFGRIASRYDATQPGAVRAMMADPDFQSAFPDARLIDHPNADMIDFGDGNPVDVLRAAREGGAGEGWQWGVGGGAGGAGGGLDQTGGTGLNLASLLGGADPMQDIMARINDLAEGNMPEAEKGALMKLLMESGGQV